jgi:hypothetical protein
MTKVPGAMEKLLRNVDAKNCSTLVVQADDSVCGGIQAYKVYVNGNVHGTPPRFANAAPLNSIYTRVAAGSYRVVVRDANQNKSDRAESNTVLLEVADEAHVHLSLSIKRNSLVLSHADA